MAANRRARHKERTTLETTRSSMSAENVPGRLCAREGEPTDQQRSFVEGRGQLSAGNTFESVTGVDISHDKRACHNLPEPQSDRDISGGREDQSSVSPRVKEELSHR